MMAISSSDIISSDIESGQGLKTDFLWTQTWTRTMTTLGLGLENPCPCEN